MNHTIKAFTLLSLTLSSTLFANSFTLTSQDISAGEFMTKKQEFNGFGCSGNDFSPQLQWENAPKNSKSFAITAYDPDAPTGSGWWHWQVINIPANIITLETNAGSTTENLLPTNGLHIKNDYGSKGFGGACPPAGHGIHHYRFTVHALSVDKLDLPADASGALAGYMINAHTIESTTLEALYQRN